MGIKAVFERGSEGARVEGKFIGGGREKGKKTVKEKARPNVKKTKSKRSISGASKT